MEKEVAYLADGDGGTIRAEYDSAKKGWLLNALEESKTSSYKQDKQKKLNRKKNKVASKARAKNRASD